MSEIWKSVEGYEGLYEVSNCGKVRSLSRRAGKVDIKGRILKPFLSRNGYLCVCLSKEGTTKTVGIHRIVATAFVPNPNGKETVNHINEDKNDNRADNLEWLTLQENIHYGTRAVRQRQSITESIGISVIQISSDGHNAIARYDSISEAAKSIMAQPSDILNSISTGRKCRGYYWRRIDSITNNDLLFWKDSGEKVSDTKTPEYTRKGN